MMMTVVSWGGCGQLLLRAHAGVVVDKAKHVDQWLEEEDEDEDDEEDREEVRKRKRRRRQAEM